MRAMIICLMLYLSAGIAVASEMRLICENPRREYLVVYTPGAESLLLNPDAEGANYSILIDDNSDGHHIVTASTPNGGPTARLHLRPYLKMEFWSGGEVMQTDGCYREN